MEPPPFGDGNRPAQLVGQSGGAPSMEPPPFGDGNFAYGLQSGQVVRVLQWSHRPSAMETSSRSPS